MAHGLMITRRDIDHAERTARHAMRALRDPAKAKTEATVAEIVRTTEVGVAAFGMGVLKGRFGPISVGPAPADFLAGTAMAVAAHFDVAGKYSEHLHNFANGLLAGYLHTLGAGFGVSWGLKAGKSPFTSPATVTAPKLSGTGRKSAPLTEAELAAMAQAVR